MWYVLCVCVCVCVCKCERAIEREGGMEEVPVAGVLIGAILSKPDTSVTVLRTCVCMLACLLACLLAAIHYKF